jgi:hypothetical protein
MVIDLEEIEVRNNFAGDGQQQFNRSTEKGREAVTSR